jgi:hypothetical protein
MFAARAWVNFDGNTGSGNTIRASGNVSSVTRNATGDYTVNFTTAMPDTNYAVSGTAGPGATTAFNSVICGNGGVSSASSVRIVARNLGGNVVNNVDAITLAIFR